MNHKIINWGASIIHYKTIGTGHTVILLHGFAQDSSVWQAQVDFLAPHCKLIVPDRAGTGNSDFVRGADLNVYADIIKEIIDVENSDKLTGEDKKVTMIGHSMGGYIMLAFAARYSSYLNKIGLFHSSAFADTDEKKQVRLKAINFINNKDTVSFLKSGTPALFTGEYATQFPEKMEELINVGLTCSAEALIQYYQAMIDRPERTDILKDFTGPVLFIIGEKDNAVPLEISLKQCYLPNQSHVNILAHSAHMGMWEETGKCNNILLSFLQQ